MSVTFRDQQCMKRDGLFYHEDDGHKGTSKLRQLFTIRQGVNILTSYFLRSSSIQTHSQSSKSKLSKVFRPLIFCMHSLPRGILAACPIHRSLLDFTYLTKADQQCQSLCCCLCSVITAHFTHLIAKHFPQHNISQQL